ncbi:MAG TPA: zf-HC2 domain-containing protein [Thermoanaerobaculia bacterium]
MTDQLLRRFLLGQLTDGEHARILEACFLDDNLHARVLAAEDDLIDAYVRGELSAEECARFEERCADTPEKKQRVEFARMLEKASRG